MSTRTRCAKPTIWIRQGGGGCSAKSWRTSLPEAHIPTVSLGQFTKDAFDRGHRQNAREDQSEPDGRIEQGARKRRLAAVSRRVVGVVLVLAHRCSINARKI